MSEGREQALQRLSKLSVKTLEDIALVVETTDMEGDYIHNNDDDGATWQFDVQTTLDALAREIRNLTS